MTPTLVAIFLRNEKRRDRRKRVKWVYPGIASNKWIYAKLNSKNFPEWPQYIKVRRKNTIATSRKCKYVDSSGKNHYSHVQLLEVDCSKEEFPYYNSIVKLTGDEQIITEIDEVVKTGFFKNIYM